MKKVVIYTDGACSKNPGPGGWAFIIKYGEHTLEKSGAEKETTNNRMELTGVINALKSLKTSCDAEIYTDSKYVVDSIEKGWVFRWQQNNWMKNKKERALNKDLWEELLNLLKIHKTKFNWVKGHANIEENEKCDKLAVNEYKKLQKEL